MIDALALGGTTSALSAGQAQPASTDVARFSQLLDNPEPAPSAVQNFVSNAENRVERGQLAVSHKLKEFDMKDNVISLVHAMHESTMNSVSVQLTSKVGSKVSDSFEQLIKQQ